MPYINPSDSTRYCAVIEWADRVVECTVAEGVSTFSRLLKIYSYPVLLQLPKRKSFFIYGCTKWNWSINSEILDICWCDESQELLNQELWVTAGIKRVSLCAAQCLLLFPLKHWSRNVINIVTCLNKSTMCCWYRSVQCNSSTKSLSSHDGDINVVLFV